MGTSNTTTAAATPKRRGGDITKSNGTNSSSKKKQASLMSFFKPMAVKNENTNKSVANVSSKSPSQQQNHVSSSSPLKFKTMVKQELTSDDKENNDTLMNYDEEEDEFRDLSFSSSLTSPPDANSVKQESEQTSKTAKQNKLEHNRVAALNSSPINSNRQARKKVNYAESDSDEDEDDVVQSSRKKRKVVQDQSDDEEDDFQPVMSDGDDDDDMSDFVVDDDDNDDDEVEEEDAAVVSEEEEDDDIPKPKKTSRSTLKPKSTASNTTSDVNTSFNSSVSSTNDLTDKFTASSSYDASGYQTKQFSSKPLPTTKKNFAKENEERYQWLVNIKDAEKRTPDDPNYDPRTLYIPQSAWSKFTAFEKQYWEIKSKMWNTIVFFKKGKFYELYENDAIIANTQFDLKIAGGGRANMKLAGIPEMSFEHWAKEFISHGYKVAKVDQKESMLAKEMRGGGSKEEKIIKRELTGVLTGGTLTNLDMITDDMSTYCLSIKEDTAEDGSKIFGVAFVDTATSELNLIELHDDAECTKLDTLITQVKPKEVICEKGNLCNIATQILKFCAHSNNQIWNSLNPITEFWDYDIAIEQLVRSKYYEAKDLDDFSNYPPILIDFKQNHFVAFNAFGGLLSYLKTLKLDESIMSLGNIKQYKISENETSHMILDGITLSNLEILNNNYDGGDQGTLLKLVNRATTSFGKRHLKKWILHPLMRIDEINSRYDSIDYLMGDGSELRSILQDCLTLLPDLERLIARVHGGTLRFRDFLKVVESFESIARFAKQMLEFAHAESGMLYKYLQSFPNDMVEQISEWEDAFDRQQALNDIIIPAKGVDAEFDQSQAVIDDLENQLNDLLKVYKKEFKSHEIFYRDSGKEIYLIELPVKLVKHVPSNWQTMGATSKVKRFWSPEVKQLARKLMEQRELHKMVCDTLRTRMYAKFDAHYPTWMKVINCIANIDCILALTKVSESIGYPSCRPQFVQSDHGVLDFKELRHPCFVGTRDFIPNDIHLGGEEPNFGLLTGANAAGKSTIMRTTALAVILSQIGCYIPASSARLTPVDRIMTRLGANDNIMQGKSTFFVELSETKKILSNATPKSLVILDELGRGGSSGDGFAIAESVLHHLATHLQPMGFFATHYNTLGVSFKSHPQVKPMRMAIIVDQESRDITFLYKLENGTAPGSFGMNVALMCGIPREIVDNAEVAAKNYEQVSSLKRTFVEGAELEQKEDDVGMSLGLQSDCVWYGTDRIGLLKQDIMNYEACVQERALENVYTMIDSL
ncbi:MSH6 [Candida theae]|uniref:DNA mismatch repair protein n=1 Tax=Candida theae TaxID=1198502 RepID=A0AAD5BA94_9ASCO|nr:MSH6 [Candida theae]KAI5948811.1 MSH6 [Candida theae]